ncbi:MAG: hypothetical protein U9Q40_02650 [Campylobacterota bacterium]|nr:hypothetical protein [Campylobacterota bacterium]
MGTVLKAIGLEHALNQQKIKQKEEELRQTEAMAELKKKEVQLKEEASNEDKKRIKSLNNEIDLLEKEKKNIEDKINKIENPVSMNIDADMVGVSKEYHDARNKVDTLKVELDDSQKNTTSKSNISGVEFALSVLIVFVVTRIISDNFIFSKLIGAFEIAQYFYPSLSTKSAFNINLFIQDILFIGASGLGLGTLFSKYKNFKYKPTIAYSGLALALSLCMMQLANILNNL